METINYIGLLCLTFLFTEGAGPVQFVKKLVGIHQDQEPKPLYKKVLQELVNCNLCSGFWLGFIYYWSLPNTLLMACITSIGAELFARAYKELLSKFKSL